jgi:hypothetical protein
MGRLLVTANVPSSLIFVALMMMQLPRSSELLVLTRATRHNVPEDRVLHSHHHENLKSCLIPIVTLTKSNAVTCKAAEYKEK